ncbi:MAG: hypothetical protein KDA34_14820 [Phycisphaerales bacterium]|nr:hypothetical protein [Phycisphaerales bacterium]
MIDHSIEVQKYTKKIVGHWPALDGPFQMADAFEQRVLMRLIDDLEADNTDLST